MSTKADLPEFDEEEVQHKPVQAIGVGIGTHSAVALGGFQDFCLKTELSNAIRENGFEHPSEVQHQALPQAMLGADVLAQAKSGMGKTAVFVFALLEQIKKLGEGEKPYCQGVVLVHSREMAHQILTEFNRFNKYLPYCSTGCFYGGVPEDDNIRAIKKQVPAIAIGTPGRMMSLVQGKFLDVSRVKYFVVDEFDQVLADAKMARDVKAVFLKTPREKQVLMFSATMNDELKRQAKMFMKDPVEVYVDQQAKLTLHGLTQFYVNLTEEQKLRKLSEILDQVEFNQCIIFTSSRERCEALHKALTMQKFPSIAMHSGKEQDERLKQYTDCKQNRARIIVATDIFGRGVDIDRINLVVQYDMANSADMYLHRVGRAGRYGTKGLTIAFLTDEEKELKREERKYTDKQIMHEVQARFEVHAQELIDVKNQLNASQYMQN
jgi:ATP-dependent RNA helicase UAP56/SUB2